MRLGPGKTKSGCARHPLFGDTRAAEPSWACRAVHQAAEPVHIRNLTRSSSLVNSVATFFRERRQKGTEDRRSTGTYAGPVQLLIERPDGARFATVHITLDDGDDLTVLSDAVAIASNSGRESTIWIHGSNDDRDALMTHLGFASDRTLLQLRRALPSDGPLLDTRPMVDADVDELVSVNNRAFEWHPEQGSLTVERMREQMAEPWFVADGLRVHDRDGRIAGFCWTKIHETPERLGEIYVIGLDPDHAGQGLGGPLTNAGLAWLADRGLDTAMLYVEADNAPARAVYDRLGFTTHRTDRLWHRRPDR